MAILRDFFRLQVVSLSETGRYVNLLDNKGPELRLWNPAHLADIHATFPAGEP
jgi:hypothetical protein